MSRTAPGPRLPWSLRLVLRRLDVAARAELAAELAEMYERRRALYGPRAARRRLRGEGRRALLHELAAGRRGRRSNPVAGGGPAATSFQEPTMKTWFELRHAVRRLARKPGFTLVAVASLSLGIAAASAIFTLVQRIVLAPLPYPEADRLVLVSHSAPGAAIDEMGMSLGTFVHYRELSRTLEGLAAYTPLPLTITGGQEAERVDGARVSAELFSLLHGAAPLAGRFPEHADTRADAEPVAVVSRGLARARFGSAAGAVGQMLELNGIATRIVGVAAGGFDFPTPDTEIWTVLRFDPSQLPLGSFSQLGVGRVREDATVADARTELQELIPRLQERFPGRAFEVIVEQSRLTALVTGMKESVIGDLGRTLWILLATVGFVLLIAGANVANLFLVDAEGRAREIAVRRALGASAGRIAAHFVSEGIVLGLLGGALGVPVALLGTTLLVRLAPVDLPRLHEVAMDAPVLAFATAVSIASGLLLALLPALHERRGDMGSAIASGGRTLTGSRSGRRSRDALAVVQIAAALVVLIGAGLMVRTFAHLLRVDPGFEPAGALTFELSLPASRYAELESIVGFHQEALARLAALPGVRAAGAIESLPLSGYSSVNPLTRERVDLGSPETPPAVQLRGAMPGYFEAAGIPLLQGRLLRVSDLEEHTGATLVSESLAARLAAAGDPVGQRVYPSSVSREARPDQVPWYTVVGVVGDVRPARLSDPPQETAYFALAGSPDGQVNFGVRSLAYVVRADVPPLTLAEPVRRVIRDLDPDLPVSGVRPLRDLVATAAAPTAFAAILLGLAALVAGILGLVGVYGVLSYAMQQRRAEVGIRMALGATRADVAGLVLRHAVALAAAGVVIGLAAAWGAAQTMRSILVGVAPHDAVTFGAGAAGLFALALAAAYGPARRAARQSPSAVLRE